MAKRFLSSLRLATLSSDPESASNGDIYYSSELGRTKFYQNNAWAVMPELLEELSDVSASGLSNGKVLTYNGSLAKWEGKSVPPSATATGTTFPPNPSVGEFFYNTEVDKLYFFVDFWNEISFTTISLNGGNAFTTEFDGTFDGGNSTTTVFSDGTYDAGNSSTTY
jgi:hypothetical protein